MRFFLDSGLRIPAVQELRKCLQAKQSPVSLTGVSQIHKAQILLTLSQDAPLLAVAASEAIARQLCDDINFMQGERIAYPYPAKELQLADMAGISREYEQLRIAALSALCTGSCRVLIASAEAAMQYTIPQAMLEQRTLHFAVNEDYDLAEVAQQLIDLGYVRCEQVDAQGQYAIRGSILDIYAVGALLPMRLEFWGDTVDTMAWFEPETQRRTDALETAVVAPAVESLYGNATLADAILELSGSLRGKHAPKQRELMLRDADRLRSGLRLDNADRYFPLIYPEPATLFDYADHALVLCDSSQVVDAMKGVQDRHLEDLKLLLTEGTVCHQLAGGYLEVSAVITRMNQRSLVCMNNFLQHASHRFQFRKQLSVEASQSAPWSGSTRILTEDLQDLCKQGYRVMVCGGTDKTLPLLMADLQASGISCSIADSDSECEPGQVLLMTSGLSSGFTYPAIQTACIAQTKIVGSSKHKRNFKKGQEIRALSEISPGDLVVHISHGIGRFEGIQQLELDGIIKDYICIAYAGTDMLYVPVTQLDLVSRYIGAKDDNTVKLNRLSGKEWEKTRTRVKQSVKNMAAELIRLYALREKAEGFSFEPDDDMMHDFESRFPYVETDDQLKCIAEIKQDMERPRPMDRLLCGDVGFGKTEVAFRAALKCVLSGKQCAMLAPTTVLANQHYETALRRFESIPLNIELLSRHRTKKQQAAICKKLSEGSIDIIIGTHRLLQKDIRFADLGLVIIDEEQRFGVAHKERFKEVFHGVDMLTLSATPIPRTLNMALSGIRDMSVIEDPPQDRYPVQSYVLEYDKGLIAQAIQRELRRGGQVYYLHNHVESILHCAAKLQELLPEARIGVAHGKMSEQEISTVWQQLLEQELDILVCTTIIETGVDIPNVNTLIIEQADRFGLSQLHQLRGRVGRSNRRAYAYFTYQPNHSLTEIAEKRLEAMREFTQFGSGFRIAMRDLELRGAGSLLGGQQHGQMEQVGYEMYLKLLNEAIAEEKGEVVEEQQGCTLDMQVEAHIPTEYISGITSRLEIYRRIALVKTEADKLDMVDELIDRFGEPPTSLVNLIDIAVLRNTAATLGITEVVQKRESLFFYTDALNSEQLAALMQRYFDRIGCNDKTIPYYIAIRLYPGETNKSLLTEVLDLLAAHAGNA